MAVSLALLALGWFMAENAVSDCDAGTDLFVMRARLFPGLPGSVDFSQSVETMVRITGLLGTTLVATDLGRNRLWRRLFFLTMITVAAGFSFLGCLERWGHAGDIFWSTDRRLDFFFATYRNVTNAGEYLNLALPLASAAALQAFLRGQVLERTFMVVAWTLIGTGSWICGSKLSPVVSLIGILLFFLMTRRFLLQKRMLRNRLTRCLGIALIASLMAAMVLGAGLGVTLDRFHRTLLPSGGGTLICRWQVDQVCLLASRDAPATGFGPGSFSSIFPYYSARLSADLGGYWAFAHDDYAQALVEWGSFGSCLWVAYFGGGIWLLWHHGRRGCRGTCNQLEGAGLLTALVLVAGTAMVDFPLQIASIQFEVALALGLAWSSGSGAWAGRLVAANGSWNFLAPQGR